MEKIDIRTFIGNGDNLFDIKLNDSLEKVSQLLGLPVEKIGDKRAGFLFFVHGVRFGYFEDEVDELAILFDNGSEISYSVRNDFNEVIQISRETQIHEFIYFLNTSKIPWKCIDEKNLNAFIILINNAVHAFFTLDTGNLVKLFAGRK